MNASEHRSLLESIRERYRCVERLTTSLSPHSDPVLLQQVVAQRQTMLSGIARDESRLPRHSTTGGGVSDLVHDIRSLILSIHSRDESLKELLRSRMQQVKGQMQQVYGTRKAARAYAMHA
jgi:hypothetical protein